MNGERGCLLDVFMRGCFERNGSAQNGSITSETIKKCRIELVSRVSLSNLFVFTLVLVHVIF